MRTTSPFRPALALAGLAGVLVAGGCNADRLNVPNYNSFTVPGIGADPAAPQLAVNGILYGQRGNLMDFDWAVGILGRESYYYFPTDTRFVTDFLNGTTTNSGERALDPGGFVGAYWTVYFSNLRDAQNLITGVEASETITDEGKKGYTGFAKTMQALDLMYLLMTRDTIGIPVDVAEDPATLTEFKSRDDAYAYTIARLDEAKADLQGAGDALSFTLPTGFEGFDTPAGFLKFNRAILARIEVMRARNSDGVITCATCYGNALTALQESFIEAPTSGSLNVGPKFPFSSAAGDTLNVINSDPNVVAHNSQWEDAEARGGTGKDLRAETKLRELETPRGAPSGTNNPEAKYAFNIYPDPTSPLPIIRNEELVLIRAEAEWFTGDKGGAISDLNAIRTISGGLLPSTLSIASSDDAFITALLYERRYSLMLEGLRWVDARRFGRLATLPLDQPDQFVAKVIPVTSGECQARGDNAPTCTDY